MTSETSHSAPSEAFPGHDGGIWEPAACVTVASWPAGAFAENIAVAENGQVFVSLHSHNKVERYDPQTGSVAVHVIFPAPVSGLCFDDAGTLWATGGTIGQPPGYVWRVLPEGGFEPWVEIDDALFMNGCTLLTGAAVLLVCESITGRIFAVDLRVKQWSVWVEDQRLRPTTPQMPGANGIKLRDGFAYISVTDSNEIYRARIQPDGSCADLELVLANLRADDFAFGKSGALYLTTHPAHGLMRVAADGGRATIAGPSEGMAGSTACAFGRTAQDAACLYVTTSGGLFAPYQGVLQDARLICVDVGDEAANAA